MKKIAVAFVLLLSCAAFTACTPTAQSSSVSSKVSTVATKQQAIRESIQNNPNIQEGATVSTFIDEEGNQQFSYKNTDGSGGGGAIYE